MPSRIGKLFKKAKEVLSGDEKPQPKRRAKTGKKTPMQKPKKTASKKAPLKKPVKVATPTKKTTTKPAAAKKPAKKPKKTTKKPIKKAAKTPLKKAVKKTAKKPAKSTPKNASARKAVKKPTKAVATTTKPKKATKKKPAAAKKPKKTPAKSTKRRTIVQKQTTKKGADKEATKPVVPKKIKKRETPKYKAKKELSSLRLQNPKDQPWVPQRSKIKAAIENGLPESYLHVHRILYLGAAHGYTVSHIYTKPMELYAVEKSREMMQHFLPVAEDLPNVLPIFADAGAPDSFSHLLPHKVDLIFQDIAQKNQVQIFLSNCERYLEPHGVGILALKARNVDSSAEPAAVFAETRAKLEAGGATIVQEISLEPYQEGHKIFVVHMNPYMDW